jgi:hypothetical protein
MMGRWTGFRGRIAGGTRRAALLLALAACAAMLPADVGAAPAPRGSDGLGEVRTLYLASVREEAAIPRALREIEAVRGRSRPAAGSTLAATLTAYEGALATLRAKHALWPPRKLQHLREGLAVLDATIAAHPEHAEARYLRLMSCYYLPSVLGRSDSVQEDFAVLARLLPGLRGQYPDELYRAITSFVLENGSLDRAKRQPLERSLAQADG